MDRRAALAALSLLLASAIARAEAKHARAAASSAAPLWYEAEGGEASPGAAGSPLFAILYAATVLLSVTIAAGALRYRGRRSG